MDFVGRQTELAALAAHLREVVRTSGGRMVAVRGRRQVGKSTLVERFLAFAQVPSAFFAASRFAVPADRLRDFTAELGSSTLEASEAFAGVSFDGWTTALRALARATTRPSILVIDELPWLLEDDPALEGALQVAWDRQLSRVPLLVIVVGSDVALMEAIASHGRPLYGRASELVVDPLTVGDLATLIAAVPAPAFDAYLVCGGFPRLAAEWKGGWTADRFLRAQLADSSSPLVVVGERILSGEFPSAGQARAVVEAVGAGETTFTGIASRAGVNHGSLVRTMRTLVDAKRVVAAERPLSAQRTRDTRYTLADPYLRFWLRFVGPRMELILRGRGDAVADEIRARWSDYRGAAVEPLVRRSVERLLPDRRFGAARFVGAYWTRTGQVDVDLVGAVGPEAPSKVTFVGSVKWRERSPFDRHDAAALAAARSRVPGAGDARLVAVSRSGCATSGLDVVLGPDDLLAAWDL